MREGTCHCHSTYNSVVLFGRVRPRSQSESKPPGSSVAERAARRPYWPFFGSCSVYSPAARGSAATGHRPRFAHWETIGRCGFCLLLESGDSGGNTTGSKMRIRPSSFGLCAVSGSSRSCLCLAGLSAYAKRFFSGPGVLWAIQQNSYVKLA